MMTDLRKLYASSIDFEVLAQQDEDFARYFRANENRVDFSNAAAVKQLTVSLLRRDFGISIELPDDRLCPPVPNRMNYIFWLQDLIDSTSENLSDIYEPQRKVIGLDIGTGASCIYPLLGCKTRPNWRFVATDIDEKNLSYARSNISRNGLESHVKLFPSSNTGPLVPLDILSIENIDFVLTNPPFYSSRESMIESAAAKSRPAFSACTGAEVEMVTDGGEVAFVRRLIEESCQLRGRVQWYSAMLGRLESLHEVVKLLIEYGLNDVGEGKPGTSNWAVKEFLQGNKTRRWAIAWSWKGLRPSMDAARGTKALGKQFLPFPALYSFDLENTTGHDRGKTVDELMSSLDVRWRYKAVILTGVVFAEKNVWSRSARRNRDKNMQIDNSDDESEAKEPALAAKLVVQSRMSGTSIDIRWIIGRDTVLFESFCGMVKRELSKATSARPV